MICFLLLFAVQALPPVSAASDFAHITPAVTPPRLIHSANPEYTPEAQKAQIEGTVVLQAVIGLNGKVTNASVLCPLPGDLDQKALAAVKGWTFAPGSMDTVEIPVLTTVDVVFRLPYQSVRSARTPLPDSSAAAQLFLAKKYQAERNWKMADYYFRLCAASGNAACEYGVGNLLVNGPNINPNDYAQGVAWLELAKDRGNKQAADLLSAAAAKLSSVQTAWVAQLKPHLEPKLR